MTTQQDHHVDKYLLFKQTEAMLEWTMARRLKQRTPTPDQPAILNSRGLPLDRRSTNGNPSRQIPNAFARLHQRIANDGHEITDLPFKHLRKTAGDLIRRFSDGEIAGIFLLHGNPVRCIDTSKNFRTRDCWMGSINSLPENHVPLRREPWFSFIGEGP